MFKRLSDEQLEKLHAASLEVMERTGIRFLEESALEIFQKGGCPVDGDLVRFPPDRVEWALRACPKQLVLYDREGRPAIHLSGRTAYYGNGSDLLFIIDHRTGERREPVLQDVRDMVTVVDALPGLDFAMSGFIPKDLSEASAQKWQMLTMLECTSKPIVYVTTNLVNTQAEVQMAEIVAGGADALRERPFAACYINISNPLRHNPESVGKLIWLSERGLPFVYRPSVVTRGLSTPITGAGFLVTNNVAGLAGLVLSQLVREGSPFIRCGCSGGTFDMHTLVGLHAAPEVRGFNEDMAEHYRLPRFGLGGLTGSKQVDQQAALEAALTLVTATLSGAQLIHDVGYMDNGTTGSLEQLVICHEILGWVRQFIKDIRVDDETLALSLIDRVVKGETDFLGAEHTLRHCRDDYYPELLDRDNFQAWDEKGRPTLRDKAKDQVNRILEEHKPEPLDEGIVRELRGLAGSEG